MCGTTEDTIRHFAQTGVLRGHVVDGEWGVLLSDAQAFCDEWRNQKARRRAAGAIGIPRQSPVRRAGGFGLEVLNASASVVSLATAVGLDSNRAVGLALAALNMLLVAVRALWSVARRRSREEAVASGRVDPDAVGWESGDGGLSVLHRLQVVCLLATVGYVAVAASPPAVQGRANELLEAPLNRLSEILEPPPTETPPATVRKTPTLVPTSVPIIWGPTPTNFPPIVPQPTEPATVTPTPKTPPPPDPDGDNVPNDGTDNCPDVANADQTDTDGNGAGDACDPVPIRPLPPTVRGSEADDPGGPDRDDDGVPDATDNCPDNYNPDQTDTDGGGFGDACEGPE
jgi:hypothetical protein